MDPNVDPQKSPKAIVENPKETHELLQQGSPPTTRPGSHLTTASVPSVEKSFRDFVYSYTVAQVAAMS
jgi:hypothetical protein